MTTGRPPGRGAAPVAILIGPPGAGKTTVGQILAGLLGVDFADTDEAIEETTGKPCGDIFIEDGETAFRELERVAAARLLGESSGVVALGSGAVLLPGVRHLLDGRTVVYLRAAFASVARRAGLDGPHPALPGNPRGRIREQLAERDPVYAGLARIIVSTDERTPQEVADEIAATVAARLAAEAGEGAGTTPGAGVMPGEGTGGTPATPGAPAGPSR